MGVGESGRSGVSVIAVCVTRGGTEASRHPHRPASQHGAEDQRGGTDERDSSP